MSEDFTCPPGCEHPCLEHSIIYTDKGLRLVNRKQYFAAMGIPPLSNRGKVAKFLEGSKAKVKWLDGEGVEVSE